MNHRPASVLSSPASIARPSRRGFLRAASSLLAILGPFHGEGAARGQEPQGASRPFKVSLSQRSLRREFAASRLDPLEFARIASGFAIDAVEYDGQFYRSKLSDRAYLAELKRRAAGEGVCSVLIMVDDEGELGAPDAKARRRAVDKHKRWIEAAAFLGCHAVRVCAKGAGSEDDQANWVSDGLRRLCRFSDPLGIDILVENQDGFSAKGSWLAEVLSAVGHARCGSRASFGSSKTATGGDDDRYQGARDLMPFARSVCAKAYDFDDRGEETSINYAQMLKVVTDAGFHGYVAIEYEGERLSEPAGITRAKQLLERASARLSPRPVAR
jgi:L-ribulose-5-phosphate 3-epimerase